MPPTNAEEERIYNEFRKHKDYYAQHDGIPALLLKLAMKWKRPVREIKSITKNVSVTMIRALLEYRTPNDKCDRCRVTWEDGVVVEERRRKE